MIVAVMAAVVLTLAAGAVRTLSAPDRYSSSVGGQYGASVEQIGGRRRTTEVAALAAVGQVRGATFVFGGVVPEGGGPDQVVDALVFAGSHRALGTRLVEGREPDPATPRQFAATRSFVESTHASLGERFDLLVIPQGPADALGFDAQSQAVRMPGATLVGVIDGPSELQDASPTTIFPEALLDGGDVGIAATQIAVSVTPGATIRELRTQIDGLPNADQFGIDRSDVVPSEVRDAVNAQGQGLTVLAAIAGLATIVVVGQVLGRQVRRSEVERLVLRSMGMTRRQVVAEPLLDAAVPTIAGVSVAVALAYAASGLFPRGFVLHVEPDPGRRFETLALFPGALAVGLLVLAWVVVAVVGFDRPAVIVNVARSRSIPYLVAAVLGVLVLLSLAHHLILSTHRRGRDLAVLRALGADRRWVTGVVHWQASLFTIVVVALGAPIGIAGGRVVYRNFVDRVGAVDTVTLPVGFFALGFAVLVALANVVATPSAHRARQRPPARTLADE